MTPAVLNDVEEWTADQRVAGAATLRALLVYAEGEIAPYLKVSMLVSFRSCAIAERRLRCCCQSVLTTLCRASSDDEDNVRVLVSHCARLVGVYVPAKQQLEVLLPQVSGFLA